MDHPLSLVDIVSIIANVALTLSFVIALVFGIEQVRMAARDRRERLTLDTLRGFQTRDFAELMNGVTTHTLPATMEVLRAQPDDVQILFVQLAQQMESLGILVADGLINVDLVDKTLGSFVVTAWEKYQPVFTDMRVKTQDPYLGEYFQWLAELIAKRMKDDPRPPYYLATT